MHLRGDLLWTVSQGAISAYHATSATPWLCALQHLLSSSTPTTLPQLSCNHTHQQTLSEHNHVACVQPVPLSLLTVRPGPSQPRNWQAVLSANNQWASRGYHSSAAGSLLHRISQQQPLQQLDALSNISSTAIAACCWRQPSSTQAQQQRHILTTTQINAQQAYMSKDNTDEAVRVRLSRAQSAADLQQVLSSVPGGASTSSLIASLTAPCLQKGAGYGSYKDPHAQRAVLWMLQQLQARAGSLTAEQVIAVLQLVCAHSYATAAHKPWLLQLLSANNYSLISQLQSTATHEGRKKSAAAQLVSLCSSLTRVCINNKYTKRQYKLEPDQGVYSQAVSTAARLYEQSFPCDAAQARRSLADDTPRMEVSSMLELLRSMQDAPEQWLQTTTRKQLGQQLVHAMLARLPWWYPEAASMLVSCMAKLQLMNDPAALVYTTTFVHACRDQLAEHELCRLLYSYGLLAKTNSTFAGSLQRAEFNALAEQAQAAVQPFAATACQAQQRSQQPQASDKQAALGWVWPPPPIQGTPVKPHHLVSGTSHQGGSYLQVPQEQEYHQEPSFTTTTPDKRTPQYPPILHLMPAAPGSALHWQDSPPSTCLPAPALASQPPSSGTTVPDRLQVLSQLDRSSSVMVQVLLDIAATVARQLKQADAAALSHALWGCMQMRLFSGSFLAAALKEFAARPPEGSLPSMNMIAMSLANLHVMGTTGPLVSKLADSIAHMPQAFKLHVMRSGMLECEQTIPNTCWALAISDQAGSLAWRKQLLAWLMRMYNAGAGQRVPSLVAHQVACYIEVLKELEWEKARQAGGADVPCTVWETPPARLALLPWQQPWLRELMQQLETQSEKLTRPTASAFQVGMSATLGKLQDLCGPDVWNGITFEAIIPGSLTSIDLLLTSKCGRVRIAVEAEGPWHFALNDPALLLGSTARRVRAIARHGYLQLLVPYWQWAPLRFWPEKVAYIQERLHMLLSEALPNDPQLVSRLVGRRIDQSDVLAQMRASLSSMTPAGVVLGKRQQLVTLLSKAHEWLHGLQIGVHGVKHTEGRTHLEIADLMRASAHDMQQLLQQQQEAVSQLHQRRQQQLHSPETQPAQAEYVLQMYEALQLRVDRVRTLKRLLQAVTRLRAQLSEDIFLYAENSKQAQQTAQPASALARHYYAQPSRRMKAGPADQETHHLLADIEDCILWVLRTELKLRATSFNAKAFQGGEAVARMMSRMTMGEQQALLHSSDAASSSSSRLVQHVAPDAMMADITAEGVVTETTSEDDALLKELSAIPGSHPNSDTSLETGNLDIQTLAGSALRMSSSRQAQHTPSALGSAAMPSVQVGAGKALAAQLSASRSTAWAKRVVSSQLQQLVDGAAPEPQSHSDDDSRHQRVRSADYGEAAQQSTSDQQAEHVTDGKQSKAKQRRRRRNRAQDEAMVQKQLARFGFIPSVRADFVPSVRTGQ